jgi:hypothetical protein
MIRDVKRPTGRVAHTTIASGEENGTGRQPRGRRSSAGCFRMSVHPIVSLSSEFIGLRERFFSGIRVVFAGFESCRRKSPEVNSGDNPHSLAPLHVRRTGGRRRLFGDVCVACQSLPPCRTSWQVRLSAVECNVAVHFPLCCRSFPPRASRENGAKMEWGVAHGGGGKHVDEGGFGRRFSGKPRIRTAVTRRLDAQWLPKEAHGSRPLSPNKECPS